MPQLLRNVRVNGGMPLEAETVKETIAANERRLGNSGRLLIRKSGTEPLIRVMAECDDEILLNSVVDDICGVIQEAAAT
jgi:phosphoglucosamine mutase